MSGSDGRAEERARQSEPQYFFVQLLYEYHFLLAHGALDRNLHLCPFAAVGVWPPAVVLPSIGRSRDLRNVEQERRLPPGDTTISQVVLPHYGARALAPVGYCPEMVADVDVDAWDAEVVSDLTHHVVPLLAVGLDHAGLGFEVIENLDLCHPMHTLPVHP